MKNQNFKKHRGWTRIFRDAFNGVLYALATQRNFIIHLIISFLVVLLAFWLEISLTKWLFLIFAIIFGLTIEMANTAFEKMVDLVTEEYSEKARIVKDLSAGMMLVASVGMVIIGLLVLFPPLIEKLF